MSLAADNTIEISVRGEWRTVQALPIGEKTLVVKGKWFKLAVIHDEEWLETELENPERCIRTLKDRWHGFHSDILTFAQKLPATHPRYTYPMAWESVAAARVGNFEDWWKSLPQETRKNVRRSQKRGVVVSLKEFDDDLIRAIADVNNDNMMRQGVRNVYYGRSLDQVRKDYSSFIDRSDFIFAYFGDEPVGFLKLVYRGDVASILNITPKSSHYDKRPANALITKAAELCAAKGISYMTYGLFNYGNKGDSPLREFKIRNGFGEVLVPRYFVPLTTWGALGMKLKLHRGLHGILPHRIITLGVSTRARWYSLKQSMSRCSSTPERPNRDRQTESSNPPAGSNTSQRKVVQS